MYLIQLRAAQRNPELQAAWTHKMSMYMPNQLIFVDESAANERKDSLHKYSSTTKLEHEKPTRRWSFLNNENVSQRDIHASNTLIYALSMTRIPAPCSYYFFDTVWHTLYQIIQHILPNFPPNLVQSFS